MKFEVVTTYAPRHWESHARRCVETFHKHWGDIPLRQYDDARLYAQSPWLAAFKDRHRDKPTDDYRMDAVRFAHKVAAIHLAHMATDADVLIWLDADCVTHDAVTPEWLAGVLRDGDFGYLRRAMKYPECGFMMFRRNARGLAFIEAIVWQYTSDSLFEMAEWHDSYVIDQVREARETGGRLRVVSLSGHAERTHHPLINGPLGAKLDHLKGPRKVQGKSNARDLTVHRTEAYWAGMVEQAVTERRASVQRRRAQVVRRHPR